MNYNLIKIALISLAFSSPVMADMAIVKETLKQVMPDPENAVVKETAIDNLYEVSQGLKILYMTGDGKHIISGSIINLESGDNLTELAINKLRKELYNNLDVASMIIYPAIGKTKRSIVVFTDINCPFCEKMHEEIPKLNRAGIEVRYLAFPRTGVGRESYRKAVSVWCAKDPAKAMDDAMLRNIFVDNRCDNNPVQEHLRLVEVFGIRGTPNIITDQGEMFPGFVPARDLIQKLGL